MAYSDLWDTERAHWDEFTRLREISDNEGFSGAQNTRKTQSKQWLKDRRAHIKEQAEAEQNGWEKENRKARYDQLAEDKLNSGACQRKAKLPKGNSWNAEKVLIREREMWWQVQSTTDKQKQRKKDCTNELVERRKRIWREAEGSVETDAGPGWDKKNREERYDNLCVATKYGSAYEDWQKGHNDHTGEPNKPKSSQRQRVVENCRKHLGVSESPPNSNRGSPQPDGWENRVYGSSGVPWCACFAVCMAWDVGVGGSGTASVYQNTQLAKQGSGIYKGYTTDGRKAKRGDHAFLSDNHTGVVVEDGDGWHCIEGNTSPGSEGSQYNGGCVAEKQRGSDITGWGLVEFDDD
jgi:hypothetical protein